MEKTVKLEDATWKRLAQIKLDESMDTFDAVVSWLLDKVEVKKAA